MALRRPDTGRNDRLVAAYPKTVATQVKKLRERFQLERIILVGDRGMLTQKRIEEDLQDHEGLQWVTALRAPQIQALMAQGAIQMSLFDEQNLAEITHPDYPGERLIVCRNPLLASERARKRKELIEAAEKKLKEIEAATKRHRQPVRGADKISYLVGKALATVERAFRSLKSVDLNVRPIHHRLPERVRAHVFLVMLAYYVEWHMRQALAPVLGLICEGGL